MTEVRANAFQATPNVDGNSRLRVPQRDGYAHLRDHFGTDGAQREVGIVLPVGCGKSGLITLAPFAARARRMLVVAPYVGLAQQLYDDFDFAHPDACFYTKWAVLAGPEFPEPAPIRGSTTNLGDLEAADVVITNIGQLQAEEGWLARLPADFFDLIVFDEGHHSAADTYETLKRTFPGARIVNFSATPTRADGQLMPGKIIYSYPVRDAIAKGYVKHLKALVLNPATLRYVRREDGREVEVDLAEVIRLGEEEADFRRSIVTSAESRDTIVHASLQELDRLRRETGEPRLKIIASALNRAHCIDIVEAYRALGRRAEFVHSLESVAANDVVHWKLEAHELDVIVQVRKLNEGFDHRYLSVAAVFSIFRSLSPFIQFVGRIMRAIVPDEPAHRLNRGTVIYHAGSNIARRWADFRQFSDADQAYFGELLPEEAWDFGDQCEVEINPGTVARPSGPTVDIREQREITLEEIPLIGRDQRALEALEALQGYTEDEIVRELRRIRGTRWEVRDAARRALDDRVRNAAGEMLNRRGINRRGRDLDPASGRENFVVVKAAIDERIMTLVGRRPGERSEYNQAELDRIRGSLDEMVVAVEKDLLRG